MRNALISLVVICFAVLMSGCGGFAVGTYPCNQHNYLKTVTECEGMEEAGWMNSGNYYYIGAGIPNEGVCRAFLTLPDKKPTKKPEKCEIDTPSEWTRSKCPWPNNDLTCFSCDRLASNGNNTFYKAVGFSIDCKQGQYFTGAGMKPEQIPLKGK
jgi:uncharacterized protein YceK